MKSEDKRHREQMAVLSQIVTELGLISRLIQDDMIYRYDHSPPMLEKIHEHGDWFACETQRNMALLQEVDSCEP